MNEDYTNNYTSEHNSYETTNNTNTEPAASEPYRYKYENGEKRENPNASPYFQSGYNTYNYNTSSYNYGNNSSFTGEVPKKKITRNHLEIFISFTKNSNAMI